MKRLIPRLRRRMKAPAATIPTLDRARGTASAPAAPANETVAPEVLTRPGGPLGISDTQRSRCVVLNGGRFLIHSPYLADNDLLSAVQRAAAVARISLLPPEAVDLQTIRSQYRHAVMGTPLVDKLRGRIMSIMEIAAKSRVSDIQIVPFGSRASVQFQAQGYLTPADPRHDIDISDLDALHNAAFAMADHGSQIYNQHLEQKATITNRAVLPAGVVGARLQWVPNGHGRHLNIRLLYEFLPTRTANIQGLALPKDIEEHLLYLLSGSKGVLTVTGPTESGKSFTLTCYMLSLIERFGEQLLVISLADPPEGFYKGIVHYPIDSEEDALGNNLIESRVLASLRVAPHFINLAEIRTRLMACQAFIATTQGKPISATLHTDFALEVPDRYCKLGVPPEDAFNPNRHAAILAQRLVPMLCPQCRVPLREAATHSAFHAADLATYRRALGDLADSLCVQGEGCPHCVMEGRIGRPGIVSDRALYVELVRPDPILFRHLRKFSSGDLDGLSKARTLWFEQGGVPMRLRAFDDLCSGRIAVQDFTHFLGSPYDLRTDLELHPNYSSILPRRLAA